MPKNGIFPTFTVKAILYPAVKREMREKVDRAQHILDTTIIRDTDPFVPMDTGMLARSVQTASRIGKGEIVYNTPYARKVYYNTHQHISTVHHPQASIMWFHHAKSIHEKRWLAEVERILKGGNGR